jgi:hypothetical protein
MSDPLQLYADDKTEPTVRLTPDQLRALSDHASDFDGMIGLLDAGAGYVKVTFHGENNEEVGKVLLSALYGDDIHMIEPFDPDAEPFGLDLLDQAD